VYTYKVLLVNSRCLHGTTLQVEAIVRIYLPSVAKSHYQS
jgi:hypothetical protein